MTLGNYLIEGSLRMHGEHPAHNPNDCSATIALPKGYVDVPKHRVTYVNGTAIFAETL